MRRRLRAFLGRHRIVLGVFLLVLGAYALNTGGHLYSIDEEGYFEVSEAMLHGKFTPDVRSDRPAIGTVEVTDGQLEFAGNLGQSALATPLLASAYALEPLVGVAQRPFFERLFVSWTNSITGALTAVFLFLCLRRLGSSERSAIAIALVFAFGTYFMPHSKTFFTEPTAALFVVAAFYFSLRARAPGGRSLDFVLLGFAAGYSVNVRLSTLVLVGVCALGALVAVARSSRDVGRVARSATWVTLGALPGILFLLGSQWARFGDPLDFGYPGIDKSFTTPIYEGVFGLLGSPGKGLLLFAPVVVLAIIAFPRFFGRNWQIASEVALIVAVNTLLFARFVFWSGDNAYGPRYMIIVLPIALLPLAAIEWNRAYRSALIALGAIGLLVPSAAGSLTYFNNVGFRYGAGAIESVGLDPTLPIANPEDQLRAFRASWFIPRYSQLVESVRAAPETIDRTLKLATHPHERAAIVVPSTELNQLYWFSGVAIVDTWLAWIVLWQGPKWMFAVGAAFAAAGMCGLVLVLRGLRHSRSRQIGSRSLSSP